MGRVRPTTRGERRSSPSTPCSPWLVISPRRYRRRRVCHASGGRSRAVAQRAPFPSPIIAAFFSTASIVIMVRCALAPSVAASSGANDNFDPAARSCFSTRLVFRSGAASRATRSLRATPSARARAWARRRRPFQVRAPPAERPHNVRRAAWRSRGTGGGRRAACGAWRGRRAVRVSSIT